jgi:flagellar basal body-associated protein FliL
MSQQSWIIIIAIVVMLTIAVVAALIWWHMADVLYPGTDKKTGQRILGKSGGARANPNATVVKGFEEPPASGA